MAFNPEKLDRIRAKEGLTRRQFAFRLGVSPGTITRILNYKHQPSPIFLQKLKEAYPEYSMDYYFN